MSSICVGGYQVLYKWLYDRRGILTLTREDVAHYHRLADSKCQLSFERKDW